jgi:hypothetical protein
VEGARREQEEKRREGNLQMNGIFSNINNPTGSNRCVERVAFKE